METPREYRDRARIPTQIARRIHGAADSSRGGQDLARRAEPDRASARGGKGPAAAGGGGRRATPRRPTALATSTSAATSTWSPRC